MTPFYTVFTQSLCSPIRGGSPVWDGRLPYLLPVVDVDTSEEDCAAGWSACRTPEDALRIAGMWPDGRPSRVFLCQEVPDHPVIERGDKLRVASWRLVSELTEEEIGQAVFRFSERYLSPYASVMAAEQMAWRASLARPLHDPEVVEQELRAALEARGLQWKLRRFKSYEAAKDARASRDAGAAWASRAAWAAWDSRASRDAWASRASWAAWDSRDSRDSRDSWPAWDSRASWAAWASWDSRDAWASWAAWDSMASWASWAAWDALVTRYMALCGLIRCSPDRHTVGISEAYRHGLAIALPTDPKELGWAMDQELAS